MKFSWSLLMVLIAFIGICEVAGLSASIGTDLLSGRRDSRERDYERDHPIYDAHGRRIHDGHHDRYDERRGSGASIGLGIGR